MELPPEIMCEIISYMTDPRDVMALFKTNNELASFAKRCVEILRYDDRNSIHPAIDVNLVLKLRHLRVVTPYISLKHITDVVLVAQMPFISQVSLDFSTLDDDFDISSSSRDTSIVMMKIFLSAFHKTRIINGKGNLIGTTRYIEPKNRFFFRCPDHIDVIIRGDTFACLSELADDIMDDDLVEKYYRIANDYVEVDKLVLNIPTQSSDFENHLNVSEFHFTPQIEIETGNPSYLLETIGYMINEGCLKRAKMYMPSSSDDEEIFDVGYDFDPTNMDKQSFPAIGFSFNVEGNIIERKLEYGIELDIPFVVNEEKIRLILEWFPKVTLIGLFLKTTDEITSLKSILSLLMERNIKAIIYTSLSIDEHRSDHVSVVKPRYIDMYSIVQMTIETYVN